MPQRKEDLRVPYSAMEMFNLVIDVERYPEFVPGYLEARILRRDESTLTVGQKVGFGPVSMTFRSLARYESPTRITIDSFDGLFESLHITWLFHPLPQGCEVEFRARARLKNGVTARLLQPWFDRLEAFVPGAFIERARALYGQREGPGPT